MEYVDSRGICVSMAVCITIASRERPKREMKSGKARDGD